MILPGSAIEQANHLRHIRIEPFDKALINPASYDLTLGDELCVYCTSGADRAREGVEVKSWTQLPPAPACLDSRQPNPFYRARLSPDGFRLGSSSDRPRIFLLHTRETIAPGLTHTAVVDGKSSLGRLGLVVHATAGYVDPGFEGQITLEVQSLGEDVIVYPGMRIAQVRFTTLGWQGGGPIIAESYQKRGNYVGEASTGPVPSRSYLQFSTERKTDPVPPPSDRMTEAPPPSPTPYECTRQNPCGTCAVCLA